MPPEGFFLCIFALTKKLNLKKQNKKASISILLTMCQCTIFTQGKQKVVSKKFNIVLKLQNLGWFRLFHPCDKGRKKKNRPTTTI